MSEPTKPQSFSFLKLAGPGLVVAATGIGSGDVVSATVGGARYGVVLLWAIVAGAFFKFVLSEGIARWQLATGKTALEGWADHLPPWVKWYFGVYLVIWTVFVSAALTNATGLGIANLTGGAISQSWGAVLHSLIGFAFVWLGGYGNFEKLMKVLVGVMGFSILICAVLTLENRGSGGAGPADPDHPGGQRHLRAVADRRRRRLDHDAVLQLLDARRRHARRRLPVLCSRRHRDRLHLHGALRHLDHADCQRRVLRRRRDADQRAKRCRGWRTALGALLGTFGRLRVLDRVLGGGVRVAARRLAERAVSVR